MTENLSAIWSGGLISWCSSYTVSGIVLKWQTKDKRPQKSNVKEMNLVQKIYIYILLAFKEASEFCLSLFTEEYRILP